MEILLLFIGLLLLIFGAEFIVRGSISLAKKLKISLFAVGIVVVSFGTSLPELGSCINSVITNHSDIAVGAIIGSNIANTILIMGATTLFCPILLITSNQINQSIINIVIGVILIFFSWFTFSFNILTGFISLLLLALIMIYQIKIGTIDIKEVEEKKAFSTIFSTILIIIGILLLSLGSKIFIESVVKISEKFQIAESIVGISIVALGTSLPELVVGIISALKKKVDFALGNVLGSNIYNVLGILAVSSFFGEFKIPTLISNFDIYFMTIVMIYLTIIMLVFKKLNNIFGIFSLIIYFIYIVLMYI